MTGIGVRDAARRLGVHENTIRNMAADGRLQVMPGSRFVRFDPAEIERACEQITAAGGLARQRAARQELQVRLRRLAKDWERQAAAFDACADGSGTDLVADMAARVYRQCARQLRKQAAGG
jgi:excisionase family DNA binding protein